MNEIKNVNDKTVSELKALIELMGWFDKYKIKMPSTKLIRLWEFINRPVVGTDVCSQPFCNDEATTIGKVQKEVLNG